MFSYCNADWLIPEITDVLRLFNAENEVFGYHFEYSSCRYFNCIEYDGKFYDSENFIETYDELEYKRYARRFAKLAFYNLLSKVKGVKMPYGALTGIRPTKLAYMELAAGRDYMALFKNFGVSDENARHIKNIISVQEPYYKNVGGQDLFISLPFCPTKCEYCSFITAPISATRQYVDDYITCLEEELSAAREYLTNVKSVYIGGGTPFCVEAEQLERVYSSVKKLNLKPCEYTVEAGRPDTFTEEKLNISKEYGVNRICINPQTFKDETLVKIGRKHTAADVYKAFEMSAKYGFNVNLDLIAGLTGESVDDFSSSLSAAIALAPCNITVHTLSLKAGSRLKENYSRIEADGIGEMIIRSRKALSAAGYRPYYMYRQKYQAGGWENCGWAKPGKECVYNIDVMEEIADNIAIGANAITKKLFEGGNRIERYASPKDIPTYISKIEKIISERSKLFR